MGRVRGELHGELPRLIAEKELNLKLGTVTAAYTYNLAKNEIYT